MAELEAEMVAKARAAGMRLLGPNCMGLYVPGSGLSFMQGFPTDPGPVGFISQSGGNAGEMIFTAAARGIRFSKAVSYGNAADIDESELLEYLAEDTQTTVVCAYVEGVKDGRRFFQALKKAAAAKPTIVLKGGRTEAGTRAVMSHTASLAGAIEVFDAACRQVNAIRVTSVDELVDLTVAFRFMTMPAGPGVAVVGGGGGFSVFAADEIDDAGLTCPVLPDETQGALREFMPVAGTSVRNPVDTVMLYEPPLLERTLAIVGSAANIDTLLFHTSFSWGRGRRTMDRNGPDPEKMMDGMVSQMIAARDAINKPIVVVLRPPLDVEGMERTTMFQEKCVAAGFPVFSTIPKAANAIARVWRWSVARA
jgi:acyl-CoA synthetase (NDP forming)